MENQLRKDLKSASKALTEAEQRWERLVIEPDRPSVTLEEDTQIVGPEVLKTYNLVALLRKHLDALDARGKFVASSTSKRRENS